jgi:DNA-binding transcriptional MerR regulator
MYRNAMNEMDHSDTAHNALYPIRIVSQQTGVNPVTLRAWERRYGVVRPQRTPKGHRLYSRQDILLIRQLLDLLEQGLTIGQAAQRLARFNNPAEGEGRGVTPDDGWGDYRQQMYRAVEALDIQGLDAAYNDALALYPVEIVTDRLLLPLLRELGERWRERRGGIAEEHFLATYLRNKLGARLHHQATARTQWRLLAACPPGEQHELGLLLFCLAAATHGIGHVLLGANTPIDEIAYAARRSGVDGILLSTSVALDGDRFMQELSRLARDTERPIFVGGEGAALHREAIRRSGGIPLGSESPLALEQLLSYFALHRHTVS